PSVGEGQVGAILWRGALRVDACGDADSLLSMGVAGIEVSHVIEVVTVMQVMNKLLTLTPIGHTAPSGYLFVRSERWLEVGEGDIFLTSLHDQQAWSNQSVQVRGVDVLAYIGVHPPPAVVGLIVWSMKNHVEIG